jgi:signal peptidase I
MEKETVREIIIDLLRSGKSAELSASGYSMFPTLRPGDKVLIRPASKNSLPPPGSIIIVNLNNLFVLHRLTGIRKDASGSTLLITRGDCMSEPDPPFQPDKIVGVADSYVRNNRQQRITCRIPSSLEYMINRRVLWIWLKVRKFIIPPLKA